MRFSCVLIGLSVAGLASSLSRADSTVDFAKDIQPIFAAHCYECHGEKKGLGRLRLHTPEAIAESQTKHDDLLIGGKPDDSQLYARLALPADDKKRMPKNADPLSEEQTALVKKWIAEGGSFTALVAGETAEPAESEMSEAAEEAPAAERPALQPASAEAIAAVEKLGALVMPLYAGSAELRISFPSSRDEVTDETVAQLEPLAGQLVELDLSGTKITDASAPVLAKLENLDTLHLEKTSIGDATVAAVAALPYLHYLNVHSTQATDAALESLKATKSLRKLYVWQTAASFEAAKALEAATPGLEVNLGWDHPGVVRERLTAELKRVEEKKAESATAITEAEAALNAAKAEQEAATAREAEIQKELEALDQPAAEQAADAADNSST